MKTVFIYSNPKATIFFQSGYIVHKI